MIITNSPAEAGTVSTRLEMAVSDLNLPLHRRIRTEPVPP